MSKKGKRFDWKDFGEEWEGTRVIDFPDCQVWLHADGRAYCTGTDDCNFDADVAMPSNCCHCKVVYAAVKNGTIRLPVSDEERMTPRPESGCGLK